MQVWTRDQPCQAPRQVFQGTHCRARTECSALRGNRKAANFSIAQRLIQDDGRGRAVFFGNERIGKQRTVTTPAPAFEKAFAMARPVRARLCK
jgi:hypothetical protein